MGEISKEAWDEACRLYNQFVNSDNGSYQFLAAALQRHIDRREHTRDVWDRSLALAEARVRELEAQLESARCALAEVNKSFAELEAIVDALCAKYEGKP